MSDTGIQSPLGVNVVGSLILNQGLSINPVAQRMIGQSKTNTYYTPGSIVNDTCLSWVTQAIQAAYYTNAFTDSIGRADVVIVGDLVGLTNYLGVLTVKEVKRGGLIPRLQIVASDMSVEVPDFQMVGFGSRYKISEMGTTDWALVDAYGRPPYSQDIGRFQYVIIDNEDGSGGYYTDYTTIGAASNANGTVFINSVLEPVLPGYSQGQIKRINYSVGDIIQANGGGLGGVIPGKGIAQNQGYLLGNLISGDGSTPGSQWQVYYYDPGTGGPGRWCLNATPDVSTYMNFTDRTFQFSVHSPANYNANFDKETYNNLLAMGQSRIPALSNSLPPTYLVNDPSNVWQGQATSGYAIEGDVGQGQEATWFPYNTDNPNYSVTQWGFLRCLALQAWNVFNWQGSSPLNEEPEYKNYATQWVSFTGFLEQSNAAIFAIRNSINFLDGTYSNMNDLISADITGVSLSTQAFGQDLINLGKALDLSQISTFGKPSGLLKTLLAENALTQGVTLALRSAGLTQEEIVDISQNLITANQKQELKIYSAFLAIGDIDLIPILKILQCKTKKLIRLADLLDVKKMFPISYTSLTVPIYNTSPGPTNSKTYYLLYVDREINPQLLLPKVKEIVGTIVPPEEPPYVEPVPVVPIIETAQIILAPAVPTIEAPPTQIIDLIPSPLPVPSVPAPDPIPEPTMPPPSPKPEGRQGGGGGGCVVLDAYLPTVETRLHNSKPVEKAWQIENDFDILLGDEQLKPTTGKVIKAMIDFQPCVKIITASGIRLSCSTTAPILTKNKGYIEAPKLFGELIAVMRNGIAFYDEVVSIDDIGYKHVRVIDTGNNSFWAGDIQNAYVLHHNARIEESLDYDKK